MSEKDVILVGNPNTGKSTIFNRLTGLHQHTGNWSGKTVGNAYGTMKYKGKEFNVIDLPGIYSINPTSEDEKNAVRQINVGNSDIIVIVLDATCLERNLILALDITRMCHNVILCVNLLDEAERKGIVVDVEKLGELLNIPVVATRARDGIGIDELKELIYNCKPRKCCEHCSARCPNRIYNQCVLNEYNSVYNRDRKLDKLFTNKITGIPIMLAFLALILWITIFGANYISGFLSTIFNSIEKAMLTLIPENYTIVRGLFIDGIYKTLSWVVAVMLPPMTIFFPLFAVLEDFGYQPRLSFNMDSIFKKVGASSKMALSMCMGFGCNAAGVIATRIIENPKERLIAVLTNAFIPCNGRFSGLIALSAVFIVGGMFSSVKIALVVLFAIMISVAVTLLVSFVLSKTILKNDEYSTILELPPFRKPKLRTVIIKSFREKILSVLSRAVVVSMPAGAIIWLFQNIDVNGVSILNHIA